MIGNISQCCLVLGILFFIACSTPSEGGSASNNNEKPGPTDLPEHFEIENINNEISRAVHKPDEFIREEGYLRDGMKSGYWFKFYNKRYKTQRIEHYVDGKLNGPLREYSMNGRLTLEAFYKDGILDGLYTEYKFGKRIREAFYVDNVKNGIERIYFKDRDNMGKLQQLIHWKMGEMDGTMEYYNPEGEVVLSYTYENGERID